MLLTNLQNWLKDNQKLTWLTLVIIVLMGAALRLTHVEALMWWGDSGRDVLVAKMIVEYGEVATTGPWAAGGHGLLQNSPVYYYFLAGLWWLTRSAVGMTMIFGLMGTACIVINYFTGRELGNRLTGLLTSSFTAFSYLMVVDSRSVFQPYAALPFIAIMYLGCLKTTRQPTTQWLTITTICLFIALHFHYSVLVVAPFVLVLIGINWWRSWAITKPTRRLVWPLVLTFLLISWYYLTHLHTPTATTDYSLATFITRQLVFLLLPNPTTHQWEWSNPFQFVTFLLNDVPTSWQYILGCLPIIGGWGVVVWQHVTKRLNHHFLVVMILLSTVLLTVSLTGATYDTYFMAYYFLIFLAGAYFITLINQSHRLVAALIAGSFLLGLNAHNQRFWTWSQPREFDAARQVSQAILADYATQHPQPTTVKPALTIAEKTPTIPGYDWGAPSYWYFLEKLSDHQLVTFVTNSSNIKAITNEPQLFYLICRDYGEEEENALDDCVKNAFANIDTYRGEVDRHPQKIVDWYAAGNDVRIYRYWRKNHN